MFLPYNRNQKKLQAFRQPVRIFSVKFQAPFPAGFNGQAGIDFKSILCLADGLMRTVGSD